MMEGENVQHRPTGLVKPSTRIPTFSTSVSSSNTNGLHEMTNSQSNVRSQPTTSIPAANGLKRGVPTPGTNDPFIEHPNHPYSQ
ncbi:hypothetical protein K449DRAFT_210509 [Hypoxylon sp. EC38]|nr:hypothetical protein K449DRAFT_210509 [Hypoxylon sp. EC38]